MFLLYFAYRQDRLLIQTFEIAILSDQGRLPSDDKAAGKQRTPPADGYPHRKNFEFHQLGILGIPLCRFVSDPKGDHHECKSDIASLKLDRLNS